MLFVRTVTSYCENHMEPTNTMYGQNAELLIVKAGGLKGLSHFSCIFLVGPIKTNI
jgi:hypothetical protein